MAFKVNYGLQRAERTRAKEAKKEERKRSREALAAAKSSGEAVPPAGEDAENETESPNPAHLRPTGS